ncbi:hypothetical protein E2C01_003632 [Portunus trituberculatus]|uniref:Uncharacterized protein n=1 Tax=Portunus trituberculatus TaxID=210409 RepID=A0A5B7CML7_PORTR|nr:hypothetical protein [Portunus trituberculatus]
MSAMFLPLSDGEQMVWPEKTSANKVTAIPEAPRGPGKLRVVPGARVYGSVASGVRVARGDLVGTLELCGDEGVASAQHQSHVVIKRDTPRLTSILANTARVVASMLLVK